MYLHECFPDSLIMTSIGVLKLMLSNKTTIIQSPIMARLLFWPGLYFGQASIWAGLYFGQASIMVTYIGRWLHVWLLPCTLRVKQ